MVTKEELKDKLLLPFATAQDFEDYLDREHNKISEVFVKLAKKASGIPSITAAEAVEVALCFGWIDGQGRSIDETWWTTRFLPRRPKSMWSKKNVDTVGRLIEQGRLRPAGQIAVDAAKKDGRWDRAYAGPATIMEPEDFNAALDAAGPVAKRVYSSLNKTERYGVLWRIETASPAARAKRIETLVQMLADGKKPPRPGVSTKAATPNEVGDARPKEGASRAGAGPNKVVKSTKRKNDSVSRVESSKNARRDTSSKPIVEIEAGPRQPRRSGLRART